MILFRTCSVQTITNLLQVNRHQVQFEQILSEAAKEVIKAGLMSGKYDKREMETAPPYMAPSTDPGDYPQVCTSTMAMHRRVADAACVPSVVLRLRRLRRYHGPVRGV